MDASISIDRHVMMEMRDGTRLAAEVYRPDDGGPCPAIIMRTPYAAEGILSGLTWLKILPTVRAGYALVIAYQRGRFGSEGVYDLRSPQDVEGPDLYDTVEWLAAQSWCDGNIGMVGESALGTVQWRTARERPPHLKAIAPGLAGAPGEAGPATTDAPVTLNIAVNLLLILAGDVLDKQDGAGQDTSEARRALEEIRTDPLLAYNHLPLKGVPQFQFPGIRELWDVCLHMGASGRPEPNREPYPFEAVAVPTLSYSGWYDPFARNSFASFAGMVARGSADVRAHQHLFVGPWPHSRPQRVLGHLDFGPLADEVGSGSAAYLLRFFNKYLKGKDLDLPAVRYFTMGSNTWREAAAWPPPEAEFQRFYFHSDGAAHSAAGNGTLSREEPAEEPPDVYIYNPLDTVLTAGGRGGVVENGFLYGPVDQVYTARRRDVLCYATPPLEDDFEVTGPLELHLVAASSCVDTDFTAKLVDVYPDGRAFNVADGIVRARFRDSFSRSDFLTPGQPVEFIVHLGPTSQLFRAGHRLRLDIASCNFPTFDRNMNTGGPVGEDAAGIPATQTVYHQASLASYIDLPVIPRN